MKTLLFIAFLLAYLSPNHAQINSVGDQPLGETVLYKTTRSFQGFGYKYQCDVQESSGYVTLYNKENKLTYEDIVYKETGKIFSCGWSERGVINSDKEMNGRSTAIVDNAFTKSMAKSFGKQKFMITMLVSPETGRVIEVSFNFTTFSPYARVPVSIYRDIEVKLKEQMHFTVGEVGKKLNVIMLAWTQRPKGTLPPIDSEPSPLL